MAVCSVHFRKPSHFERLRPALITVGSLAGISAVAAVLRFWELGLRTIQGGETTASLISAQVARGGGYEQLPDTHGPLQYFLTAAAFRTFGTGDVTARAMPALFGVLLALLPLLFARHIGRAGSIVAALLLAVSPTMVYYSRFAGPDVYLAFFTLATAMVIWRYLAEPHRVWLYLLASTLAFMLVTTEMALTMITIFAAYLAYRTGSDFIDQTYEPDTETNTRLTHYELLGVGRDAHTREIRLAYKKAIDRREDGRRGGGSDREALANAYHVLTTANRREAYDRQLAQRELKAAQRAAETHTGVVRRAIIMLAAGPIAIFWPFAGAVRRSLRLKRRPDAASPLIVITMLTLPFFGPLVEKLPFVGDRGFYGQQTIYVIGGTNITPGGELPVMLITLGVLFALAGIVGMAWRWNVWIICWAMFYGITITLFTGFFTDKGGIWTGIWGTLDYWWRPEAQHVDGPAYYYAMLLPAYEILPIAVAIVGAAALMLFGGWRNRALAAVAAIMLAAIVVAPSSITAIANHRTMWEMLVASVALLSLRVGHMTKFLAFWTVASFMAFSTIGRKDPWLAMHIALPLSLLAAKLVDNAVNAFEMPSLPESLPSIRLAAPSPWSLVAVVAGVAAAVVFTARTGALASWGHGSLPQLTGALATSDHGDTPIELIQPDRVAPDVREVVAAVDRAAKASGEGYNMPIALDTSYDFAQGWLWYLRDYRNLQIEDMRRGYQVPDGAIALFDARNRDKVHVSAASTSMAFTNSWSFPGIESRLSASDIAGDVVSADWWSKWSRYVIDRTRVGQLDANQGVAYFPSDLSAALPASRQSDVLASAVAPEPLGPPVSAPPPASP
jgi:predicted membrane-bound mannosyltransferase